jgi:hypothetical protein
MGDQGTLRVMRTGGGLTHRNAVRKRITTLRVERLTFLTDHGLLTDKAGVAADWKSGGARYVELEGGAHWQPALGKSFPASVTKGTTLQIELELSVDPPDADPIEGTLHGEPSGTASSPGPFLAFESALVVGGSASVKLSLTAKGALPNEVFDLDSRSIAWKATIAGEPFDLGATGPHHLYVTYGAPNVGGLPLPTPFGPDPAPLEDGITDKRMSAAVTLTDKMSKQAVKIEDPDTKLPMDRDDPHVIAHILIASIPGYTLKKAEPPLPPEFGHPGYFNDGPGMAQAGAWPIFDFMEQKAECQAIVRFVRGMLLQIGCPGEAHLVVVYAHADVDKGATALEDSILPPDPDATKYRMFDRIRVAGGLNRNSERVVVTQNGVPEQQQLSLADSLVHVGDLIEPGLVLNSYEACLKFTFGGKTRYYGGGVPGAAFKSALEVIGVFYALVWTTTVFDGAGKKVRRVEEIVHIYQ